MRELLALSQELPLREVEPGHVLVREGERSGALYVLERGAFTVARAGVTIAVISAPGSLIGEVAVLAGGDHSATVTATIPSAVRAAEDGEAFLLSSPEVMLLVAKEVAQRLQGLVGYVVELKVQASDGPGLEVMDEILARLSVWRTEGTNHMTEPETTEPETTEPETTEPETTEPETTEPETTEPETTEREPDPQH